MFSSVLKCISVSGGELTKPQELHILQGNSAFLLLCRLYNHCWPLVRLRGRYMELNDKLRYSVLESSRLAGEWYCNGQNTPDHPWGGVHDSADKGRYIYEYYPATKWCYGMGVWGQGLAIMGLMTLARRLETEKYRQSAMLAAEYMNSLQIINPSDAKAHGGFREHTPQMSWSYPRDGATGAMGYCALYKETGKEEYLERARLFCKWYSTYGSYNDGWPRATYDLATGEVMDAESRFIRGDWQAGGGLCYYWLYKLTGETQWMDCLRRQVDILLDLYDRNQDVPIQMCPAGRGELIYGNDDFALLSMMAAWRHWREPRMLKALQHRIRRNWTTMQPDGSYPYYAGTFVSNIENVEYLELCRCENLTEDLSALEQNILTTLQFGLTLQETSPADIRAYGGLYGQSHYGVSRDRIHHRDVGYSMILHLRLAGKADAPYYSTFGWDKADGDSPGRQGQQQSTSKRAIDGGDRSTED